MYGINKTATCKSVIVNFVFVHFSSIENVNSIIIILLNAPVKNWTSQLLTKQVLETWLSKKAMCK